MAGEIPPLNITVNLETSSVKSGVDQATASIKNISAAAEGAGSKFTGLKTVMLGTFASSAIQKGLSEIKGFLEESVKAAEEAQTSIAALSTAMNNAKVNTDANREAIMKSTEAMGALGFKGNDVRNAFTKMVTATGSVTESQRLMGVAADYARLKHQDLASAASILTRGTTGAMRAFREFGITLDTHIPKNQAISKAFDELNKKIGGQAAAYAQTYAGKMEIIGVQTEDLKEKVGSLLLPVLTKLEGWFIGAMKWLSEHKAIMEAIAFVVGTVLMAVVVNMTVALYNQAAAWLAANFEIVLVIAAIGLLVAGFVFLWNKFDWVRKGIVGGLQMIIHAVAFVIRALAEWASFLESTVLKPVQMLLEALSHLPKVGKYAKAALDIFKDIPGDLGKAADSVDHFADGLEGLANKKISIKFPNIKDALANAGGAAGGSPDITGLAHDAGGGKVAAAAAKQAAALKKAQNEMLALQDKYNAVLTDRQNKMDKAKADWEQKQIDAQTKFDQAKADIDQAYQDKTEAALTNYTQAVESIEQNHQDSLASIRKAAADNALQIEQNAVDKRQAIIQQSMDVMTSTWEKYTKIDLGSLFISGGNTATGLATSLKSELDKILQLQKDAGKLSAAGYSQSFIDQVIAKGPVLGDQMAQAVLNATPETAAQIKDLYGQIDSVSQNGLDALAKSMNDGTTFATQAMAQAYAQVGIDLQKQLADNQTKLTADLKTEQDKYTDALNSAQEAYAKALTAAGNARDIALKKAQDSLTNSLQSAQEAYDTAIKSISDSTDKQLTALMAKIDATAAKIVGLGGQVSGIPGFGTTTPAFTTGIQSGTVNSGMPTSTSDLQLEPRVSIHAPITVDGSTAPNDIQNAIVKISKFGMVGM